ncbi:hypothetical protein [Promicromonospora sukumoe]|uniref:hypothetical protein n=1 Tax=Promicromonospora sukumoe TaxID=88382 RepID=UPI0012F8C8E4|nr:hypothetical protein [Promicromonospora sukumoe]
MDTLRRSLALTPVAFGVTAVVLLFVYGSNGISWRGAGEVLLGALAVTAAALVVIRVAAALLRLLAVRNDWVILGTAAILATVVLAVCYFFVAASLSPDDVGWELLYVVAPAILSIPVWPGYAIALLIRRWRERTSRRRPGSAAGARNA